MKYGPEHFGRNYCMHKYFIEKVSIEIFKREAKESHKFLIQTILGLLYVWITQIIPT